MSQQRVNPRLTPVRDLLDRILIVYAVDGTSETDLSEAKDIVRSFSLADQKVSAEAFAFAVPAGSKPGTSLGAELGVALDTCIGGIVFVDKLRPNVAYELGYLHGKGRSVLLVTRTSPQRVWKHISDLAGAPIADLRRTTLDNAIREYLTRLYRQDPRTVEPIPTISMPSENQNLTVRATETAFLTSPGPFGQILALRRYNPPIVIPIARSVSPAARAQVIMRVPDGPEHVSVYFRVWYSNQRRDPASINVGTTTHRRDAWITRDERQIPCQMFTADWTVLVVQFSDLFRRGSVLGTSAPYYLEEISFRVGHRIQEQQQLKSVEVAFVGVYGFDD